MINKIGLGEVCDIQGGYAFKSEIFSNNGIPIIRIGDINNDVVNINESICYPEEFWKKNEQFRVLNSDILIAMSGATVGKIGIFNLQNKALLNQRVGRIRVNKENAIQDYVLRALKSDLIYSQIQKNASGCAQPNISTSQLQKLLIPLPSLPEQKRIADELDKAYSAIEKQKKQLALFDELIKSKFNEMFGNPVINDKGWDVKSLNEICDVRDGTHDSPKYVSEGYPLITSKNVSSGFLDFSQVNLISKEDYDNINKRSKVDLGDILMPMIGTIGKPIIVNIKPFFAIKNMALIKFSKTNIINIYIFSLLSSEFLKIKANDQMKGGTQKFMSLGTIRALKIPIPPLPLQQQFADFVNEVEETKLKMKESLTKTETLYKALMQKYFEKGE